MGEARRFVTAATGRHLLAGLAVLGPLLAFAGCGDDVVQQSFRPDDGTECDGVDSDGNPTGTRTCADGQLCLQGRCFSPCDSDADCGRRESCQDGVCVPSGGVRDASVVDREVDPCFGADTRCVAPTPACDPVTGECVACLGPEDCATDPDGNTVCDIAYRRCVAPAESQCAACNETADCSADESLVCVGPTSTLNERVCVPMGTACEPPFMLVEGVCLPRLGCTGLRNGISNGFVCVVDADCTGGSREPDLGQCEDERCRVVCGVEADCPEPLSCDGAFCVDS
ncbi:MAG: hypothetical protein AAGF12_28975 [Myxococcota bacterium]